MTKRPDVSNAVYSPLTTEEIGLREGDNDALGLQVLFVSNGRKGDHLAGERGGLVHSTPH